jgi:hypothetical protein
MAGEVPARKFHPSLYGKGTKMKKFAFLAMVLGSMFLYGCGETKPPVKPTEKPSTTTTTPEEKKDGATTTTPEEKKDAGGTEEKK